MTVDLNNTQRQILKMFSYMSSEKALAEVKSLLVTYLSYKVVREADKAFDETNYSLEIFEKWKNEH